MGGRSRELGESSGLSVPRFQHLPYGLSDMTVADMHATHVTTGANDCVEHKARPGGESPPPGPFSAEAAPTHRPGSDAEG